MHRYLYLRLTRLVWALLLMLAVAAWRLPISSRVQGSSVTEAVWSGFSVYGFPMTSAGVQTTGPTGLQVVLANGHTLTRFQLFVLQQPVNCTTTGTLVLQDLTANTVLSSLTLANGRQFYDSGALSVAMTAGHTFAYVATEAPSGCYTIPAAINFTAVYEGNSGAVTEAGWSGYNGGTLGLGTGPEVTFANNHTLTRFLLDSEVDEYECTTNAVVALKDMTTGTILTSLALSNSTNQYDSGPLSISMTGGHTFAFVGDGGAECTGQAPSGGAFTAIYE